MNAHGRTPQPLPTIIFRSPLDELAKELDCDIYRAPTHLTTFVSGRKKAKSKRSQSSPSLFTKIAITSPTYVNFAAPFPVLTPQEPATHRFLVLC